jgi:hypothetical protein
MTYRKRAKRLPQATSSLFFYRSGYLVQNMLISPCRMLANFPARKESTQMPRGVKEGSKRGRQYEHIKDSYEDRGVSEKEAA